MCSPLTHLLPRLPAHPLLYALVPHSWDLLLAPWPLAMSPETSLVLHLHFSSLFILAYFTFLNMPFIYWLPNLYMWLGHLSWTQVYSTADHTWISNRGLKCHLSKRNTWSSLKNLLLQAASLWWLQFHHIVFFAKDLGVFDIFLLSWCSSDPSANSMDSFNHVRINGFFTATIVDIISLYLVEGKICQVTVTPLREVRPCPSTAEQSPVAFSFPQSKSKSLRWPKGSYISGYVSSPQLLLTCSVPTSFPLSTTREVLPFLLTTFPDFIICSICIWQVMFLTHWYFIYVPQERKLPWGRGCCVILLL